MKNKTLKKKWSQRRPKFEEKNLSLAHPVVKASYIWSIISDQICDVLGPEIHYRWFKWAKPVVISHNVLIMEVPNHFTAQWIHTHYHELVDIFLSVLDRKLSSFFISQSERSCTSSHSGISLLKGTASEVNCQSEN